MLKYVDAKQTFREVPDEVCLSIELSQCPNRCEECHSPQLREDIGEEFTEEILDKLIEENEGISCIVFLGGDGDCKEINKLACYIQKKYERKLKVCWYSGRSVDLGELKECEDGMTRGWITLPYGIDQRWFNYLKFGPYVKKFGPLNVETTNQRMFLNTDFSSVANKATVEDITWKFQVKSFQ